MTSTFSVKQRIDSALAKFGIQLRSTDEIRQMAHDWHRQRRPELPENVAALPGYQAGAKASEHWHEIEAAIQAAMKPDISKLTTLINPQNTSPLPARDITYQSTPYNPATPTPEAREKLFSDVTDSLIVFEDDEELLDPERTDRRVIVRKIDAPRNTVNMRSVSILEMMASPTHEQSTGENERLPEKHWML